LAEASTAGLPSRATSACGNRIYTKSGLMLGLGERADEVRACLADLRAAGCDIVTIGQYLSPSSAHHPVARFADPGEFAAWQAEARALGFAAVASGPFVRSSYQAESVFASREDRDRPPA
jgi:lipoic acid synthetase